MSILGNNSNVCFGSETDISLKNFYADPKYVYRKI